MKRSAPMTRTTPLVNRAPMRRGEVALRRSPMPRKAKRKPRSFITIGKFEYVRSERLLALFRQLPCPITGRQGPNDPAHSNWQVHGKGKGIKASDVFVAALAPEVHRELDQGKNWLEAERQALWWRAHVASVRALLSLDLWPANIPVPDIEHYPF
jgi:hypothetical protein